MKRREFLGALGMAAGWSLSARAQQATTPVIGFLNTGSAEGYAPQVVAFRQGLQETGYRDGQNVAIAYRWANDQYDRIPAMAAELVDARVAVIVANGLAARSAKATQTIPIVFIGGGDPVETGLVASINRPGGNITGVVQFGGALGAKRLELLLQLVPDATAVALLINPDNPTANRAASDVAAAAQKLGVNVQVLAARTESELSASFSSLGIRSTPALLVSADPFFLRQRTLLATLATRNKIPAIYDFRDYAAAGGLMSYGASLADAYRQLGIYAGRILKGERPAELPVLQPTKFELVINLKAAKALGLAVPDRLNAVVDEVIE